MFLSTALRLSLLVAAFAGSLGWLLFLVKVAAPPPAAANDRSQQLELAFPSTIDELKTLSSLLIGYSHQQPAYVLVLFASAYLFKQTFAIPGSVFLNLLGGALYGLVPGFLLCSLLTATGATCCYLLSAMVGTEFVERFAGRQLAALRSRIPGLEEKEEKSGRHSQLLSILISLRLFPMSPNWALNIASPLIGVPLGHFYLSVLLGLMPYNFICVQTGSLLSELQSLDDLFNLRTFASLLAIAAVFAAPTAYKHFWVASPGGGAVLKMTKKRN